MNLAVSSWNLVVSYFRHNSMPWYFINNGEICGET